MINLIYVVERIGSAFPSQVLDVVSSLADSSQINKITLIVGLNPGQTVEIEHNKVEVYLFKRAPAYPVINWLSIFNLALILRKLDLNNSVFHCRDEFASYLVYRATKFTNLSSLKMLTDVRGAVREELIDFLKIHSTLKYLKLKLVSKCEMMYESANHICCVSSALKDHLISNYGCDSQKISVIPCCGGSNFVYSETSRAAIRKQLSLKEDDIICVFSTGGDAAWQNSKEVISTFTNLHFSVLMLSPKTYVAPNVISLHVSYFDMPDYLSAADVAVMLREETVVNKVASPIKVSEYLCCGLPLITNNSVQSAKDLINESGFGLVVDDRSDIKIKDVKALTSIDRNHISTESINIRGVKKITALYLSCYHDIISNLGPVK